MKSISAYIREESIPFVQMALEKERIFGMTLRMVMGRGDQRGITLQYWGGTFAIDLLPKVRMDVVVPDSMEKKAIQPICTHASTGKPGDGRIFVIDVEESIRVRTHGVEA